jgi:hypothetical protein
VAPGRAAAHHRRVRRLIVPILLAAAPARAERPLWLDHPDWHAHFWVSYGLSLTLTEVLEGPEPSWGPDLGTGAALGIATGSVAALGLFKEFVVDDEVGQGDLLADGLGLLANVAVQLLIDF